MNTAHLVAAIRFFDNFHLTHLENVLKAKKAPKKNTFKKKLNIRSTWPSKIN